ncbi:MAG: phosphoribosylamine--glycine ligase [Clostridiales bacterium]|nr:phosphoribosylamine--glycine ligase [Clostridiales bacterium]
MKIMVIGGGGREHAIIKKIRQGKGEHEIYCLPGNAGMAGEATCIDIKAKEIDKIVEFARENGIEYAIVAQDDPLALGCVDRLNEVGVPCFGPTAKAAEIESSKVFAKNLMKKYGIPTSEYEVFDNSKKALKYVKTAKYPIVIKADGLALGKGVTIAQNEKEAVDAIVSVMETKVFGESGNKVVIEEFMEGPEVSVLSFCDGKTIVPMVSSMDHKRAYDGDNGPNTGGMGTIAPNPFYTPEVQRECEEKIIKPTVEAMRKEGRPFKGCLYFGLMVTKDGPKVVEYNCRFGDPETQVVLPLLESDLLEIMLATTNGTLDKTEVRFSNKSACCVVLASQGYPVKYEKGYSIFVPDDIKDNVYFAGVASDHGELVTNGGRVLGVTTVADDLKSAIKKSYKYAKRISFRKSFMRTDIGAKALNALENNQ